MWSWLETTVAALVAMATTTTIVGVEIVDMRVPAVVESGARPFVILDCDFDLTERERTHLDVKWFFGDDPQPFFQWLPGRRPPQVIGELFRDRLDLHYHVEGADKFRKHRALKILRPTTELTGVYKCKVGSLEDEDFMAKKMVVYAPATDVSLIYTKPDSKLVNLSCSASGAFPLPEVKLSWGPRPYDGGETTTLTVERDGRFDVAVHKLLSEDSLSPETVFGCSVAIPGTAYSVREETMYFPGKVLYQLRSASSASDLRPRPPTSLSSFLVSVSLALALAQ